MNYSLDSQPHSSSFFPEHLFSWVPGKTPLSSKPTVYGMLVMYLAAVYNIQGAMSNRDAYSLKTSFRAYNLCLSFGSLLLLLFIAYGALPMVFKHGPIYSICSEDAWTPTLELGYILNYYLKYIELFDTIFIALRKKHISLLHVYHHAATVLLTHITFDSKISLSWPIISLNLITHIFMYFYFYASTGGAKVWWKKYLPWMQILQFLLDLGLCLIWWYARVVTPLIDHARVSFPLIPQLPQIGGCAGDPKTGYTGFIILTSYLVLFFNHYFKPLEYLESLIVMAEIKDLIP